MCSSSLLPSSSRHRATARKGRRRQAGASNCTRRTARRRRFVAAARQRTAQPRAGEPHRGISEPHGCNLVRRTPRSGELVVGGTRGSSKAPNPVRCGRRQPGLSWNEVREAAGVGGGSSRGEVDLAEMRRMRAAGGMGGGAVCRRWSSRSSERQQSISSGLTRAPRKPRLLLWPSGTVAGQIGVRRLECGARATRSEVVVGGAAPEKVGRVGARRAGEGGVARGGRWARRGER